MRTTLTTRQLALFWREKAIAVVILQQILRKIVGPFFEKRR